MASDAPAPTPDPFDHPALGTALRELARRGELRRFRRGAVVIHEGDDGHTMFIILSGRLRAFSANATEDKEVTFGSYGPGDYVGEISLDGGPRSASVDALEPTLCAVVTRHTIEQYLKENPAFAWELLAKVARRARDATLNARRMALEDVYGRLRGQLLALAVEQPDGTRQIAPKPTHKAIAQRIGCGREMVSRVMKQLERGEYLRVEPDAWVLLRALPPRY